MAVSVLFNEPKLLKLATLLHSSAQHTGFSALQRAEIAETSGITTQNWSAGCFSALQRAEIAEMLRDVRPDEQVIGFSALQRAEIAETANRERGAGGSRVFQCSSTSRNC